MDATDLSLIAVVFLGIIVFGYAYLGYPLLLWIWGRLRPSGKASGAEGVVWPPITISVPVYNEEHQMEDLIRSLLDLDYPRDRLQLLIVSDASTDGTDQIAESYQDQGIQFVRIPERGGKTKAENFAASHLTGDIIVNTDASIRIRAGALKPLISALVDPAVGLASGRDISVGSSKDGGNTGESGYVGYEMKIRDLETRVSGIVGASGCFYAIRSHLHRLPLPDALSRDFAAALHTREHGFRAVSVPEAVCLVPRTGSLRQEYRRKVRTITRGMATLSYKKKLLNPFAYGAFSWMLFSHKLCRWALPWFAAAAFFSLAILAPRSPAALALVAAGVLFLALAIVGWALGDRAEQPKIFSIPGFLLFGNLAAMHAFLRRLRGVGDPLWEPTRRSGSEAA